MTLFTTYEKCLVIVHGNNLWFRVCRSCCNVLGADITDYFNYGFTDETWKLYCEKQRKMKSEIGTLSKIAVSSSTQVTSQSKSWYSSCSHRYHSAVILPHSNSLSKAFIDSTARHSLVVALCTVASIDNSSVIGIDNITVMKCHSRNFENVNDFLNVFLPIIMYGFQLVLTLIAHLHHPLVDLQTVHTTYATNKRHGLDLSTYL